MYQYYLLITLISQVFCFICVHGYLNIQQEFNEIWEKLVLVFLQASEYESILKVKTSIGNAPISINEMEVLITNHVKEYVLNNTWW